MLALLLEPASPYCDQYSLAGVTIPEQGKLIVEVVGHGFDASDVLRGDIQPHERWEASLEPATLPASRGTSVDARRIMVVEPHQYAKSVECRLAKIGARTKNPAFPDASLKNDANQSELIRLGTSFLKATHQTLLLRHAESYAPISQKYVVSFARQIQHLLSGLSAYGIHLGSSSFAASMIPKRGLIFWDFFPARKQEAASLYPSV